MAYGFSYSTRNILQLSLGLLATPRKVAVLYAPKIIRIGTDTPNGTRTQAKVLGGKALAIKRSAEFHMPE